MFDEILEKVSSIFFGRLTYAEWWGQLASVGERIAGMWA